MVNSQEKKFGTGELSEGTADAVFLSLRLAAVARHHRERVAAGLPTYPLVLDDALITLDDQRAQGVLEVLADLEEGLQVVVFTHHPHLGERAADAHGAQVSHIPQPERPAVADDVAAIRQRARVPIVEGLVAKRVPTQGKKDEVQAIRAWAIKQGMQVGQKGRIPKEIREAYAEVHPE